MKQPRPVQAAVTFIRIFIFLTTSGHLYAQTPDYEALRQVVWKWNDAINTRSATTLRNLYGDRVLFYARDQKRSTCVLMKQDYWRKNPLYTQKVIAPLTFKTYTNGTVKVEFIKEAVISAKPYRFQAYLLISNGPGKYQIIGESDLETDRRMNFRPELGKEVPIDPPITKAEAKAEDSVGPGNSKFPTVIADNKFLDQIQAMLGGSVTVTMPKLYLAGAASILLVSTLLLLVLRKAPRKRSFEPSTSVEYAPARRRSAAPEPSEDEAFISFVLTLFDPLFFRIVRLDRSNAASPIEIEFQHKENAVRFAIQCKYLGREIPRMMKFASPEVYQKFETETAMELYLISGAGGDGANPKEVYLIPVRELQAEMAYDDIIRFKKFGMFFYHIGQKRLQ
ncbi:MAG TPA: hypothetical protein VEB86_07670 [Chryseosolibacter sp.]|nr:hypothetical protein [Chryseosolibacter sp.]